MCPCSSQRLYAVLLIIHAAFPCFPLSAVYACARGVRCVRQSRPASRQHWIPHGRQKFCSFLLTDPQSLSDGLRLNPTTVSRRFVDYVFCLLWNFPYLPYLPFPASVKKSVRLAPCNRHVQALQRPQEPAHVQQHSGVSVSAVCAYQDYALFATTEHW